MGIFEAFVEPGNIVTVILAATATLMAGHEGIGSEVNIGGGLHLLAIAVEIPPEAFLITILKLIVR